MARFDAVEILVDEVGDGYGVAPTSVLKDLRGQRRILEKLGSIHLPRDPIDAYKRS